MEIIACGIVFRFFIIEYARWVADRSIHGCICKRQFHPQSELKSLYSRSAEKEVTAGTLDDHYSRSAEEDVTAGTLDDHYGSYAKDKDVTAGALVTDYGV